MTYSEFYDYDFDVFTKKYEILGLEPAEETSVQDIKKAYRKLALELYYLFSIYSLLSLTNLLGILIRTLGAKSVRKSIGLYQRLMK